MAHRLAEHPWLSLLIVILAKAITQRLFAVLVVGVFEQPRAVFGAPVARTDHTRRAVRAAMRMRAALSEFNRRQLHS